MNEFLAFTLEDHNISVYVHVVEIVTCREVLHIYHYSVIINISDKKNKLVSLYRKLTGEWINHDIENDDSMISHVKKQIELHDDDSNLVST